MIVIEDEAREVGAFLAWVIVAGVAVGPRPEPLDALIERLEDRIRRERTLEFLKDDPIVRAYRKFFWKVGIDPTKTRPSAEALARRVLRGSRIPAINNVVDAGNAASLETMIPIGLYDVKKLEGRLRLRRAVPGEEFRPIGGRAERLTGREIVLADDARVVHLFPHRDSDETKVTEGTNEVLVVACGVPGVEEGLVVRAASLAARLIAEHCGGEVLERVSLQT